MNCNECKHYRADADFKDPELQSKYSKCMRPGAKYRYTHTERMQPTLLAMMDGSCGKRGRFFIPISIGIEPPKPWPR